VLSGTRAMWSVNAGAPALPNALSLAGLFCVSEIGMRSGPSQRHVAVTGPYHGMMRRDVVVGGVASDGPNVAKGLRNLGG